MLIYSMTHLNSLGKMFPNLTIIRGQRLFSNYALVIYDSDLVEVSLSFISILSILKQTYPSDHTSKPAENQPRFGEN